MRGYKGVPCTADHMAQGGSNKIWVWILLSVTLQEGKMAAEGKLHRLANLTLLPHSLCKIRATRKVLFSLVKIIVTLGLK